MEQAISSGRLGSYTLQAAIAAVHSQAPTAAQTNWSQIVALYDLLLRAEPSPIVELNRAAAVGFGVGPQAGLELLAPLLANPTLERYQPLHAAHADLLRRAGDSAGAARAYERAISLSANAVERAELQRRLSTLDVD